MQIYMRSCTICICNIVFVNVLIKKKHTNLDYMLDCLKTALKFRTALSYIREMKMLFCA